MTRQEWQSLSIGSIITNRSGKNARVVIDKHPTCQAITLQSNRSRNGKDTVYSIGDKKCFKTMNVKVKIKTH